MFGRARTIRTLKDTVRLREAELRAARLNEGMWRRDAEQAIRERAEWQQRAERFSLDRSASEKKVMQGRLAAAGLTVQAQATIAERDATIARLQQQVDDADVYGDRALLPAQPTPEVERLRRDNRRLAELVAKQQEQLSAHQAASIAADRARPKAVAA
jgi:hypothetical protein